MGEQPQTMICDDNRTHLDPHYWQNPHDGLTYWCPGHVEVK
jgi:hypothetical protein